MPTWTSPGRAMTRPMMSAPISRIGREHDRVRHQPAVVRTGDGPGHVRDGEPDEHDRPGCRRRRAAQQHDARRRRATRDHADPLPRPRATSSPRASVLSIGLQARASTSPTSDERRHAGGDRRRAAGERADDPEAEPVERVDVEQQDRVVIEPSSAVSEAPASASLTGVAPSRPSEPEGIRPGGTPRLRRRSANHT